MTNKPTQPQFAYQAIFDLIELGVLSYERLEKYAERARDGELAFFRDRLTEVIVAETSLHGGTDHYGAADMTPKDSAVRHEMDVVDTRRRLEYLIPFVSGARYLDFGCGVGYVLKEASQFARSAVGVEPSESCRQRLTANGINVAAELSNLDGEFDCISLFHVLEHLDDPLCILRDARNRLAQSGTIIVEVPHARDFLLDTDRSDQFRDFTLWSEHLILHTRISLRALLKQAGFENIVVQGIQRSPLGNHLSWLTLGRPTGLRSPLLSHTATQSSYEQTLAAIDRTDTLLAIAHAG